MSESRKECRTTLTHLKTLQPRGPDADAPDLTNLLLDEPIDAPCAADASDSSDATGPTPSATVVPLLIVPLIQEAVIVAISASPTPSVIAPAAAPHQLRAAHLGLEAVPGAASGRDRDDLAVVVALGHVVDHAARVADGRHGGDADAGGEGDVARGHAVGTAVHADAAASHADSSPDADASSDTNTSDADSPDTMNCAVTNAAVTDDAHSSPTNHPVSKSSSASPVDQDASPVAHSSVSDDAVTDGCPTDHSMTDGAVSDDAAAVAHGPVPNDTVAHNAVTDAAAVTYEAVADATVTDDPAPATDADAADAHATDMPDPDAMPDSDAVPDADVTHAMGNPVPYSTNGDATVTNASTVNPASANDSAPCQ